MTKTIKAIIFDLDGTILNTLNDLKSAVDHALFSIGRRALDIEEVRRFVGNGVPKLVERALDATGGVVEFERCLGIFTEYYNAHSADKTRVYDGVGALLCSLKSMGLKTAVVTNKYDAAAKELKVKFFDCVDFIVGTGGDIRPKPAPDGVLLALETLGLKQSEAIYVGDGETDVSTAKNSGLPSVAVTWGFRDRPLLESLSPDFIIDRPEELVPAIEAAGYSIRSEQ